MRYGVAEGRGGGGGSGGVLGGGGGFGLVVTHSPHIDVAQVNPALSL